MFERRLNQIAKDHCIGELCLEVVREIHLRQCRTQGISSPYLAVPVWVGEGIRKRKARWSIHEMRAKEKQTQMPVLYD